MGKYTNLNFIRQAMQLTAALERLPEDVFVIKCRTDFCIRLMNMISRYFYEDLKVSSYGVFHPPFRYKIVIVFTSVSSPFFSCDIVFFGHKTDIKQMMLFENTEWFLGTPRNPDSLFFMNPFIHHYAVIGDYVRIVKEPVLNMMLRDKLDVFNEENFYLPGILNKFYALYFVLLYSCFCIVDNGRVTSNSFYTVFKKKIYTDWQVAIDHPETIRKIVFGEFDHTDGFKKLCTEIQRIGMIPDYAKEMEFTESDYSETVDWAKKFDVPIGRWLKWNRICRTECNHENFENAAKILFSDYHLNKTTVCIMKNIAGEATYYQELVTYLDEFLQCDKDLYIHALSTASRGQNGSVIRKIGKMLYYGEVEAKWVKEVSLIFERYNGKKVFYTTSVSGEKLSGIFYYGKYMLKKGSEQYAKSSYLILRDEWKLKDFVSETVPDYTEGLKVLAKHKLEQIYQELGNNKLVLVLTDFLLDVCEESPFSEGYLDYLEKEEQGEILKKIKDKY